MPKALELLENLWQNVKTDKAAYNQMVAKILKQRDDAKKDQRRYYSTLSQYGMYGKRNASTDIITAQSNYIQAVLTVVQAQVALENLLGAGLNRK